LAQSFTLPGAIDIKQLLIITKYSKSCKNSISSHRKRNQNKT